MRRVHPVRTLSDRTGRIDRTGKPSGRVCFFRVAHRFTAESDEGGGVETVRLPCRPFLFPKPAMETWGTDPFPIPASESGDHEQEAPDKPVHCARA